MDEKIVLECWMKYDVKQSRIKTKRIIIPPSSSVTICFLCFFMKWKKIKRKNTILRQEYVGINKFLNVWL